MNTTRRTFLQAGATSALVSLLGFDLEPAHAQSRELKISRTTETRSTCPYCAVSCGVIIHTLGDKAKNVIRSRWEARIERARELEKQYPVAADVLRFYRKVAEFQRSAGSYPDAGELVSLLALVEREGPPVLAEAARNLQREPILQQRILESGTADPMQTFFARVLRQPRAELAAAAANISKGVTRNTCPFCGERPVVAALRPEGEGGKRELVCSLCFTEWEFRRLLCIHCGEEDHRKLPVYKANEFPHLRAEACDSCRHYIKAVDLTLNGLAIPEVDELAAIPLDLWLQEKDYIKLQPNILGL